MLSKALFVALAAEAAVILAPAPVDPTSSPDTHSTLSPHLVPRSSAPSLSSQVTITIWPQTTAPAGSLEGRGPHQTDGDFGSTSPPTLVDSDAGFLGWAGHVLSTPGDDWPLGSDVVEQALKLTLEMKEEDVERALRQLDDMIAHLEVDAEHMVLDEIITLMTVRAGMMQYLNACRSSEAIMALPLFHRLEAGILRFVEAIDAKLKRYGYGGPEDSQQPSLLGRSVGGVGQCRRAELDDPNSSAGKGDGAVVNGTHQALPQDVDFCKTADADKALLAGLDAWLQHYVAFLEPMAKRCPTMQPIAASLREALDMVHQRL